MAGARTDRTTAPTMHAPTRTAMRTTAPTMRTTDAGVNDTAVNERPSVRAIASDARTVHSRPMHDIGRE
ncbi:hypothetical protein C4B68_40140 (plasmid) [Streptomyces dengpaensis]|uniref:Uncharacterized protein n=1 Tax=Streptomyces dengpaensis TaxID=2049881 RepID=A0ABM6T4V4_9ACTN|nr:hypothetical protein C4B68_40140 [Streptomyces dengpaensis]PIB05068.1 hypothetical protein B1C81_30645 [Streptomyces sp. HG99]